MKFSVIIPTYNRKDKAARAVRSVLTQSFDGFELLVCDDGSTDGTLEALAQFKGDPRFKYLRAMHFNQAKARNMGIRSSAGEWVVFLDSDDIFMTDRLDKLATMIEHTDYDFIYCNARMMDYFKGDRGAMFARDDYPTGVLPGYYAVGDKYAPYVTSTVAIRRAALGNDLFREDMKILEDTERYARLFKSGARVGYTTEALVWREVHAGQITHDHLTGFKESMMAYAVGGAPPHLYFWRSVTLGLKTLVYMAKSRFKKIRANWRCGIGWHGVVWKSMGRRWCTECGVDIEG